MKMKFDILFEEVLTYLEKDGKLPHPNAEEDAGVEDGDTPDQQEISNIENDTQNTNTDTDIETECARN